MILKQWFYEGGVGYAARNNEMQGIYEYAEKLSKEIGNNRAWMSQIESRRLKKIKREDVIKIYKLLLNESNEKEIERIAADIAEQYKG